MENKIFIGKFTVLDLVEKKDKKLVEIKKKETGYKYVYTKIIKKCLHVWLVNDESYLKSNWI